LAQTVANVLGVVVGSAGLRIGLSQLGKHRAPAPQCAEAVPESQPPRKIKVSFERHSLPKQGLRQTGSVQETAAPGDLDLQPFDLDRGLSQGLLQLTSAGYGVKCLYYLAQSV
jgi:hypothetical protein